MHTILRLLGRGFLFVLFVSKANAQTQTGGISGQPAGTPGSFQNSNNRRLGRSINALNPVRFGDPGICFGSPQFGNINSRVNSPRLIQMALKLIALTTYLSH